MRFPSTKFRRFIFFTCTIIVLGLLYKHRTVRSPIKYMYLTQTPSCLSDYYLQPDVLGDGEQCQCFVIVTSYKQTCRNVSKMRHHIQYIDIFHDTLNAGKNKMYEYSHFIVDTSSVLYYIFLDDDLTFNFTADVMLSNAAQVDKKVPILRSFEKFIAKVQPALSTGMYSPMGKQFEFFGHFLEDCCDTSKYWEANLPEFYPMIFFDDSFLAYHHLAIKHLFPLPVQYDHQSFWMTIVIMKFRVYARYRGQALRYNPLHLINKEHREYPNVPGGVVGYERIMEEERLLAPTSMQDSEIWTDPYFLAERLKEYSIKDPPFRYVPFSENPQMKPYRGL